MRGRKVAAGVRMLVVPGSQAVKRQAEAEGLDRVFRDAGAEWREPGCSMCIAMNGDQLEPGQYAVSTSNRNFEGRQGRGGRTFLASPLTAAAAAVTGRVTDVARRCSEERSQIMTRFTTLTRASSLAVDDIDTDQIIPARFLKVHDEDRASAQQPVRRLALPADGSPTRLPAHARAQGAQILARRRQLRLRLVARARAVGARRLGLPRGRSRARSPTSSRSNALKNGLLPVALDRRGVHASSWPRARPIPTLELTIDLAQQRVTLPDGDDVRVPDRSVREALPGRTGSTSSATSSRSPIAISGA